MTRAVHLHGPDAVALARDLIRLADDARGRLGSYAESGDWPAPGLVEVADLFDAIRLLLTPVAER